MLFVALAQLAVVATSPDTILVGERATIRVTATVTGAALPQLRPLGVAPFTVVESATSSEVQTDRYGRTRAETELRLVVVADRPGSFLIAPFEARAGGEWARSRPLRIVVRGSAASREPPPIVARAPIEPDRAVNFHAMVLPETVYVGQQATYQVGLFVESSVRARLRRNPEFVAPEMRSMLTYDLLRAGRTPFERLEGRRRYEAHIFERAIFPLTSGRYVFPPARLTYAVPTSPSFFSREETQEAHTDSVALVVLDPPVAGRPADFSGVVGRLTLATQLDGTRARVGDPLTLVVRVAGIGNVKLFPRPTLRVPWASVVPAGERVNIDSAAPTVSGTKEFEWVLTPRTAGELELSPIRYPYFDPEHRRYEIAESASLPITVAPGSLLATANAPADSTPAMSIRREWRGAPPAGMGERRAFWLAMLLAPVPAIGLGLARRPRRGVRPSAARILRAVTRGAERRDMRLLRRAFVGALAERVPLGAGHFAVPGALARSLRRAGVSTDTAARAESLLGMLDDAAFARHGEVSPELAARTWTTFRAVDHEARSRAALDSALLIVLTAFALGSAASAWASAEEGASAFARGVSAYDARHYDSARAHFGEAARAVPTASEAWANYGTAGWVTADTAAATVGWQRALRLEPLASDVRERAELVYPMDVRSIAWVAPVPLSGLAVLGALLWLAAWSLALLRVVGRDRWARDWGVAAGASALLIVAIGSALSSRRRAEDLVVVARRETLRALPALGADAAAAVSVGEIAITSGRRGVWTRVALDGGREGWIASELLVPLDASGAALAP